MNKYGSIYIIALMYSILFFFLGLALANPLTEVVNEARATVVCSWTNLTVLDQTQCTIMELYAPFYIGVIFAIAGAILGAIIKY